MRTICIESPVKADTEEQFKIHQEYAKACLLYVLEQRHAPSATHLQYTQVWNDLDPKKREAGIKAGIVIGNRCGARWVFTDFGISEGMKQGIRAGESVGQDVEYIELGQEKVQEILSRVQATPGFGGAK